jgi:predicted GH43/DUF377 family glycosyl hydrolase
MKNHLSFIKISFIASIIVINYSVVSAQTEWTYYSEDPVLSMDPLVEWGAYGQPNVLIHNDTIKMWFAVAETTPTDPVSRGRIHYAWSLDGYTFTKYENNPVLDVGSEGEWDYQWLDTPGILWDGTGFKLYYYGDSLYHDVKDYTAIGLATSDDGINWTKQGKVLEMGGVDDWDGHHVELPELYFDSEIGLYAMLYTGINRSNYPDAGFLRIGLALSYDGYDWMKYENNPVMNIGTYPSFNDIGVGGPSIIETDGIFEMWYTGIQAYEEPINSWDSLKVGYAISLNGTSWIQYPTNPVIQAEEGDSTVFWAFDVIWDESDQLYKMYFESEHWAYEEPGTPGEFHKINAIFLATAPRTVLNSPSCNTNVSDDITIDIGANTQLLASGGDYYQWDPPENLSNTEIANPIASPTETTIYTVLIVSEDCITKEQITVTVDDPGIIEDPELQTLEVFPNPTNTESLKVNKMLRNAEITITNSLGQIVFNINEFSGEKIMTNNKLKPGTYIISIDENSVIYQKKLIVK